MQPATLLAILASVIATAEAGCYGGGATWAPDQVQANNILGDVCNSASGNFGGGETKYQCRNAGTANKKLEFWVTNTVGNALWLGHGDCVLRLSNEINGCQHGGDSTISGWGFR